MTKSKHPEAHVSNLHPNPWNTNVVSPENEARIDASMRRLKMFKPIIVRNRAAGGFEILGGEHRWLSAKRLGIELLPIFNVGDITEEQAKEIGLADNARYGEDDSIRLAELLRGLGSASELSTFLPMSGHDLEELLATPSVALTDLDMPASPAADAASATPTHQLLRFKVPIEDTAWITAHLTNVMRAQNFSSEDSMTNAGNALVHILNKDRAPT
jgi:ParB family chromosome partitioning protein